MGHPRLYLLQAGDKGRGGSRGGWVQPHIELSIIGIAMKRHIMLADNVAQGEHIDVKKGRPKDRSLWNSTRNCVEIRLRIPQSHVLSSISEIGPKPPQGSTGETNYCLKTVEENFMVNCIKMRL